MAAPNPQFITSSAFLLILSVFASSNRRASADDPEPPDLHSKLLQAVVFGQVHALTVLLREHGTTKFITNQEPLFRAAVLYNHLSVLEAMVAHGADPNVELENKLSLLDYAVVLGRVEIAGWLLEARVGSRMTPRRISTPLHLAAFHGHRQMAELMLAKGPWSANEQGGELGWTPLHTLAQNHPSMRDDAVKWHARAVLEGAMLDWELPQPPVMGVQPDVSGTAQVLLAAGADPHIKATDGVDPLLIAVMSDNDHIAGMMLAAGADPSYKIRLLFATAETDGDDKWRSVEVVDARLSKIAETLGKAPGKAGMLDTLKELVANIRPEAADELFGEEKELKVGPEDAKKVQVRLMGVTGTYFRDEKRFREQLQDKERNRDEL